MSIASPLRYPDTQSPAVMTRRAWWLLALNFVIPGSAQALAGNRRLGKIGLGATLGMWAVLLISLLVSLLWPSVLFFLGTSSVVLVLVQILLVLYGLLWAFLTLDTFRLVRLVSLVPAARLVVGLLAVAGLVVASGTALWASSIVGGVNSTLSGIFSAAAAAPPIDGQYNFLILGGDSGADRDGLRPDTAQVVSVNADTGAATIIGLPRDLQNIPFVAGSPMATQYPDGYTQNTGEYCTRWACLNTVYVAGEIAHPDLYPKAAAEGSSPGIEAMRAAAEGITGLTIPYFVLIDIQGLTTMIDALGGVDIDVAERIAIAEPGTPVSEVPEWIEAGPQHLSGYFALSYARSRYNGLGDYDRMARQQVLQEALLRQMNPANVLTKFQGIAAASSDVVKTNIPQSMLGYFVQLGLKTKSLPLTHAELTPASETFPVDTEFPDYPAIRAYIQNLIHPSTSTPTPAS
jgi:LCP family protein required for cell wall assembly